MFATVMVNKRTQKDYDAFLTDIVKRLLLLEKDIHILLIAHRQTVKFDFARLISRKDAAAIFGYSVRQFDRICNSCHIKRIHVPNEGKRGFRTFFRWGDLVHDVFVNSRYDIPLLGESRRRHKYSDEFERAYVEFFNERKLDLEE